MSTVIKLKKSSVESHKPTTSDLEVGEVALNSLDQRLFTRDSNNNIVMVGEAGGLRHESSTVTHTVTVATKTSSHRYHGSGSSSGYQIDGSMSPALKLVPGVTYRFDQSDSSNSGHPLRFYLDSGKTTAYTTGVTTNGTAGSAGAYTEIVVSDTTPPVLHYQCSSHSLMGNQVLTHTRNLTGFDSDDLSEGSTNLYYTDARVDSRISAATIDADTLNGQNPTYYLDYNNFSNTPTIPSDVSNLTDTTGVIPTDLTDLSISDGSAGQFLRTDGAGNFAFATVTSSGGSGIALTDLSVTQNSASGIGTLTYNNVSGVFAYTPPALPSDLSDLTDSTGLIPTDISDLTDTTSLIPSALTDLGITDGTSGQVLTTDGSGGFTFTTVSSGSGGSGSTNVIAPVAFAFVNTTSNGSGTGISWGNWNSSNSTLDFTFTTAQSDANYTVVTDSETFDDYFVGITNKTTTGFRAEFYDGSGSRTPSSFSPFTFMIYASTPTVAVSGGGGDAFKTISVNGQSDVVADSSTDTLTLVAAGLNSITTDASTDTITIGTPTGIPFVKEDGTSTSLNLRVEAGTLSQAVSTLYIPFTKEDGTSVTTLVMS